MRKLLSLCCLLAAVFLVSLSAFAQGGAATDTRYGGSLPGACNTHQIFSLVSGGNATYEGCTSTNTWSAFALGSGTTFQVDGTGLSSSSTVNFQDALAFNGLTLTFTNPSAGNVKLVWSGTLGNAGLTNSSMTVGSTSCTLGSTCAPSTTVNGTSCVLGSTCTVTASGSGVNLSIPNDTTTGTTVNKLAKMTSVQKAIITATTDTIALQIGIVTANAGTSGTATIAISGVGVSCVFDGGTTAGDYVINSVTIAGDCHDTGSSTYPTAYGNTVGMAVATNSGAGTYTVNMNNAPTGNGIGGGIVGRSADNAFNMLALWTGPTSLGITPTDMGGNGWGVQRSTGQLIEGSCCGGSTTGMIDLQPTSGNGYSFEINSGAVVYGYGMNNAAGHCLWCAYSQNNSSSFGAREVLDGSLTIATFQAVGPTHTARLQVLNTTADSFQDAPATTTQFGAIGLGENTSLYNLGFDADGVSGCLADNTITIGHYLSFGTGTAAYCRDIGTGWFYPGDIIGQAMNSVSGGATADVVLSHEVRGGAYAAALPVDSAAQTSSIGSTSLLTPSANGMFRACYYFSTTTAGSAGTVSLSFTYTDNAQAETFATSTINLATLGANLGGCQEFYALTSAALKYLTTVSGASGSPQYDLHLRIEAE
jgi:hypothetical protein